MLPPAFLGGAEGDGELCISMQMHWPVCQVLQTVEDRHTHKKRGKEGGRRKKEGNENERRGT